MDDNNSWIHTPPNGAPNNGPGNDQQQNNNNNLPMHLLPQLLGVTWSDGFITSYVKQRTSPPPYR